MHPGNVEVPAQHINIPPPMVCVVLPSFSHFAIFLLHFSHVLSLAVPPLHTPPCTPPFCLCPSTSLFPIFFGLVMLKSSSLPSLPFPSILPLSVSPPFFFLSRNQRLPFPHFATLSLWNLSNSPCTHTVVPLIACSITLPFFLSWLFLPWLSDNCWSMRC